MLNDLLNETATVQRGTESRTSGGGVERSWSDVATIRCRRRFATADEVLRAGSERAVDAVVVYAEAGVDVQRGDRLVFSDRTYHVQGVTHPRARSAAHHTRIVAEVVQP